MNRLEKPFETWKRNREGVIENDRLERLQGEIVLIKYGGNAMDPQADPADDPVLDQIAMLAEAGMLPVVVHGGGPAIRQLLTETGLESEFIGGHRKTDKGAMRIVEMALSGEVNGKLVSALNRRGARAVGLTGKDASMVRVERRFHETVEGGQRVRADIGFVGNVATVDPSLIHTLLENNYLPVVAPVSAGVDGHDYNVNADMFAGHLAGALHAAAFVAVTDVDGLRKDPADASTLISRISAGEIREELGKAIQGGMIPKVESCLTALEKGVESACIVSGTRPDRILDILLTSSGSGTIIIP